MREVDAADVAGFFAPERPGPLIWQHVVSSGVGSCRADRWPAPRTVVAESGGNVALRGEPRAIDGLAGFVEAPPEWLPTLRAIDRSWPRWHAANRDVIGPDPDLLHPGQRLQHPVTDTCPRRTVR